VTGTHLSHGGKPKVKRISRQPSTTRIIMDQKQLNSVVNFNCFGNMMTNDARYTLEIKSRITKANASL
jgi:hypothetical protein